MHLRERNAAHSSSSVVLLASPPNDTILNFQAKFITSMAVSHSLNADWNSAERQNRRQT